MQKLNTTVVYILSVVGFLCCWLYGLGTVAAIIAVVLATKELNKYKLAPDAYTNGPAMKTARIVAYVALVLSFIGLIPVVFYLVNPCAFWDWYLGIIANNPGVTEEQLAPIYEYMEASGCR